MPPVSVPVASLAPGLLPSVLLPSGLLPSDVLASGLALPAVPASSTSPMTSPTRTVEPLSAACRVMMPATGEGTSTVTLSVSSSTSGWSTSTRAPTGCSQLAMMASVMDSPRAGTLIELGMVVSRSEGGRRRSGQARLAKASSRISLRSRAWLSGEPVAGLALAARPT